MGGLACMLEDSGVAVRASHESSTSAALGERKAAHTRRVATGGAPAAQKASRCGDGSEKRTSSRPV
eukprot:scaffold15150_cov32-Tisochrysis_lutea.AAC.3